MPSALRLLRFLCVIAISAGSGCGRSDHSIARSPLAAPPVDTVRVAPADTASWRHTRAMQADLNGDGNPERLVIASDVVLSDSGQPLWEDGHRWAAYVAAEPMVTLLYGAFVPNGHVEAAVLSSDAEGRRHVLVQERTPSHTRSLVIAYDGRDARAVSEANYAVERWLPALAR